MEGDKFIEKIIFKDSTEELIDVFFVAYGSASSIDFARNLGIYIENNNIIVDENQKTNVDGVYAAGDCIGGFAQVSTAAGQGAVAGQQIKSFINSMVKS